MSGDKLNNPNNGSGSSLGSGGSGGGGSGDSLKGDSKGESLKGMASYERYRSFRDTLYGKVRYGKHIRSGTIVVIKEYIKMRVEKKVMEDGTPIAEDALEEIRIHQLVSRQRHPHVVQMYDVQQDKEKIYTILEYCGKGEFFAYVQNEKFSNEVAQHYFRQLMSGVAYLHSRGVCHRDLSLENLLMDDKQVLKICDFGVAVEAKEGTVLHCTDPERRPGKIRYMAPEVFLAQSYDPRSIDVWSCGVILFVMLVGAFPFEMPASSDDRFQYIFKGHIAELLKLWNRQIPNEALDLLARIFTPANKRITVQQILAHPFCTKRTTNNAAAGTASPTTSTAASVVSTASTSAAVAAMMGAPSPASPASPATPSTASTTTAISAFGTAPMHTSTATPMQQNNAPNSMMLAAAANANSAHMSGGGSGGAGGGGVAAFAAFGSSQQPSSSSHMNNNAVGAFGLSVNVTASPATPNTPTMMMGTPPPSAANSPTIIAPIPSNASTAAAMQRFNLVGGGGAAPATATASSPFVSNNHFPSSAQPHPSTTATAASSANPSAAMLALQQQTLAAIAHAAANHLSITLTPQQLASLTPQQIAGLRQKQADLQKQHAAQKAAAQQQALAKALASSNNPNMK